MYQIFAIPKLIYIVRVTLVTELRCQTKMQSFKPRIQRSSNSSGAAHFTHTFLRISQNKAIVSLCAQWG